MSIQTWRAQTAETLSAVLASVGVTSVEPKTPLVALPGQGWLQVGEIDTAGCRWGEIRVGVELLILAKGQDLPDVEDRLDELAWPLLSAIRGVGGRGVKVKPVEVDGLGAPAFGISATFVAECSAT